MHIIAELQARFSKLRFSRNNAVVGIFASVGLAVVTHGTSLFGLLFSGPKFFYYTWKLEKLRVLMKENGIPIPKRRIVEFVAPLLLGTVVAGFGLGLDAIAGLGAAVLSPSNFLSGIGSDAANAVKDLATASGPPPSEAFEAALSSVVHALGSYPGGGTGPDALVHHMRHGSERLYDLADSVQHGDVVEHGRINIAEEGLQECVSKSLEGVTWNVIRPLGQPESKSSKRGLPVNISRLLQDRRTVQQRSSGKTAGRQFQLSSSTTPGTHTDNSGAVAISVVRYRFRYRT
ncbi:hypothetical protein FRB90_004386 [Tulasnella sp. 427]|nr:hypothetical protein FRB90_004386 [Tulasnella sp. 427]